MSQHLCQSGTCNPQPVSHDKAVVVGIYGIPGSGKSYLLKQLENELGKEHFAYYEGSKAHRYHRSRRPRGIQKDGGARPDVLARARY